MILIDSLYINNSGGKILLDYLIYSLEKSDKNIFYLLDERVKSTVYQIKSTNKVQYAKANYNWRKKFYKKNSNLFSTVFCFGNLPPNLKIDLIVYTYFHQPMYLNVPREFSRKDKVIFFIKTLILRTLKQNTNYWMVQNETIKNDLSDKFDINMKNILVIPFYPPFKQISNFPIREKFRFIYVSGAAPHKNHIRLIQAFCSFYDKNKIGTLVLTVGPEFFSLINLIDLKKAAGYPIENIGFIKREELQNQYLLSEYCIFPSLAESFGLGLIESIENGCKVIGSDLPYMHEVCEPSISFNPLEVSSIEAAIQKTMLGNIPKSKPLIADRIDELLKLLN